MGIEETTGSAVLDEAALDAEKLETENKFYKVTFIQQDGEVVTVEYEPGRYAISCAWKRRIASRHRAQFRHRPATRLRGKLRLHDLPCDS